MSTRVPRYGLLLPLFILGVASGCDRVAGTVTTPAPPSSSTPNQSSVSVEPLAVRPEFLHSAGCVTRPPFGVRISVTIRGEHDLILRHVRFAFIDRFGDRTLPDVTTIASLSSPVPTLAIPTSSPVPIPGLAPLPSMSPIPIPGSSPVNGVLLSGGTTRALPFFVRFGCGVDPHGILRVTADTADRRGAFATSDLQVRVVP